MTPDQQEELQLQRKTLQVQQELSKVASAEHLFELGAGALLVELLTTEITRLTRDVTSSKYEKDHGGYIKALADLHAHRNLLRKLQVLTAPEFRARVEQQLAELDDGK